MVFFFAVSFRRLSSLFSLGDHEADYIAWDGPDGRSVFFVDAIFLWQRAQVLKKEIQQPYCLPFLFAESSVH